MTSKFLPVLVSNARYQNAKLLEAVERGAAPFPQLLSFCGNHRVMGIGALLLLCDTESFLSHLYKSGRAFLHYLRTPGAGAPVCGKSQPFFDAIAALDWEGARELAFHLSQAGKTDVEYEEDFLFVQFLARHALLEQPAEEARGLLTRYEAALQGTLDARLGVCRALLEKDAKAFNEALEEFLSEREAHYRRLKKKERIALEQWATEAQVSVEGLALLRLAERAGLESRRDHLFIPSLARGRVRPPDEPDSWRTF
ncbi:immunity 49 family protein [Pyxidicoccus fallax]|uniref:Immunity 49 family protein n=1 Tax=Pyxidicoccus fallax TaxID=394095 RepID=A0A848LL00_9BACT|nr:Imm49 family immunity protein [Pyxidicoccus fallax]NMO18353.1 immunity 49 family protein [Pyxidicoccus fallax]NPC83270.1 immunity 49 family protein [Pyxidicoccus fallax]